MKSPIIFATTDADMLPETAFKKLMTIVSDERRIKAGRFHRREDACRSLLAEALLKYTFICTGLHKYSEITLKKNEFGKPQTALDGFHFNISHSGAWVICAVDNQEIGVDVERIHKVDSGISQRFFSSKENELLNTFNLESDWLDNFYRFWVLKESYIKAIGKGLHCPLNSFSVLPEKNGTARLERYDESLPQKYFKIYEIDPAYKCALCCSHQNFPEKVDLVEVEEILEKLEI
ncbi:MAG TPA: 4'-phosphopantetheinyl transferase superfamily protein [Chitinispirillaceae bacterium]|nr:4'-phosphopantetheinyl transferase superfamily protein [Chitinispirillaceae bacterium]